jgi:hypothetical protein
MANRCPNKGSSEWKVLVNQVGEDTAWATWQFHKFDFPLSISNTSTIKKDIGLRNGLSELQLAMMAKRLEKYNAKHGTSHSFDKNKIGQADLYNPVLRVSYFPKKITQKIIEDGNMNILGKETTKAFMNTNPTLFIQEGNQYFKDGNVFATAEDALYDSNDSPSTIVGDKKSIKPKFQELADRYTEKATLLRESIRKLKVQERQSTSPTEKVQLNKRIEVLEDNINKIIGVEGDIDNKGIINEILKLNALEDIEVYANEQLNSVEDIFKKDTISKEEADFARKVVGLWLKAGDFSTEENLFWSEEDLEDIDKNETLRKVKVKFNEFRNRAEDIQRKFIFPMELQLVSEAGLDEFNVDISGILNQPFKDVSWGTKELLDISEVNHPLAQLMSQYLKNATFGAHQESIVINDEVDRLISKIDKLDWELFQQEFSNTDNRRTGNLTFRFSQEYFDTVRDLFTRARNAPVGKAKNAAYKEAIEFTRKNSLVFDVRKLFADKELWGVSYSEADVNTHIKELKDALGEIGYQQYYERAQEKVEKYKLAKEAQKEYYNDVVFKDNPALAEAAMQQWEANNSPAAEAELVEKGYPVIKVGENYVMPSGKFTIKVPKRTVDGKDTGFYDKKFQKIEADENLRALYDHIFNTLNDLKQYLPHQQIDWMQVNSLPTMYDSIIEEYTKNGMHSMLNPLIDSLTEAVRMSDLETTDTRIRNPLTGEPDKHLQTQMLINYNNQIKKEVDLKILEYKQSHSNENPTFEQIVEFKKDAANNLSKLKTFDLGKLTKAYALMALTYKHKSSVQDVMEASNNILKRQMEQQENNAGKELVDKFGNPIKVAGLPHFKEMMDTFMDTYYGYSMDKPFGQGEKIYTSREKVMKERLEIAMQKNNESLEQGKIKTEEHDAINELLQDQLDVLGGIKTWSKYGDLVLQYVQLKGMGWNVFAGITNMTYGFVANITEASDGRNYNMQEFWKAQAKVLHTIGGVNKYSTEAKKIRNLIKNLDTLKVSRYELYKATTPGTMGKMSKKLEILNPYKPQKSTEYINQATVLVAMMLHQKVTVDGKEVTLYDAYDNEGKLLENVEFPGNLNETKVKIRIDKVIKMNHGNYDPDSPLNAKRHLLGRALSQFRTWAFQGFAERFMGEMTDFQLGITRKGRYRSFSSFYKAQKEENGAGFINSTFFITKQLMRKATFGKYNTQFNEVQGLSEVDAANMRKNMTEIMTYVILTIFALMLKTMFDDTDKSKAKYIAFFWINQLTRLNTDMSFYVSPVQFEKLTRNAMPAFTAVIDTEKALRASWGYIFNNEDDILQSGRNKGRSKAGVAIQKLIPNPMNAIDRVNAAGSQIFSNKPNN